MSIRILVFIAVLVGLHPYGWAQQMWEFSNGRITLKQSLSNSSISTFKLNDHPLNPLGWSLPMHRMPKTHLEAGPFQGHFMALGHWGLPAAGEQAAGLVLYGELNTTPWTVSSESGDPELGWETTLICDPPHERLLVSRSYRLFPERSVVQVSERVENRLPIGRPIQWLQHPTIGAPFLSKALRVDANVAWGFHNLGPFREDDWLQTESQLFDWPSGISGPDTFNLRRTMPTGTTQLFTFAFEDSVKWGWVTAANPEQGLLLGYLFDPIEYPWVHFWYSMQDDTLEARAFEFSQVGISEPLETLVGVDSRIRGRASFEWLDAGASITKGYWMFLMPIDSTFQHVEEVQLDGQHLELTIQTTRGLCKTRL
ncbi:hypothetical protein [Pontibacter sp. G13]|uniref:hypothetical protein n=1 Tax=Pontibacter sp. G13 TaxID=3074898 RepID=UPI00288A511A|nr:hypothetical protein [Pontibacter sp. G13]WNJ17712.1 hypothetical protein RJD25_22905 [Pontibacter sp. G13]